MRTRSDQSRPRRSLIRRIMRWTLYAIVGFFAGSILLTIAYRWIDPPLTPLMVGRWVEYKLAGDSAGIDYRWKPLEAISTNLQRAVLASEDKKFFRHNGFDWDAIENNWDRLQDGAKHVKGASTISMQTARNVFLWQGRNWIRKGLEAYFTVLIEFFWGKRRILEVYLNVIEMGRGIYGAEAAAQNHFGMTAAQLAPPQAALVAAVLPNPRRWTASTPTGYIRRRQSIIMRSMMGVALPKKVMGQ